MAVDYCCILKELLGDGWRHLFVGGRGGGMGRFVIILAGKLASKPRRDNCNTTWYLRPKTFDGNNLSDVTTPKQKREEKQTSLSPVLFHFSRHASSPMLQLQVDGGWWGWGDRAEKKSPDFRSLYCRLTPL